MIREIDRLLGIDFHQLAAFQAIVEEGSFHSAAERLGYTQSAVSQQIAALESMVGAKLIHRPGGPRKISLTDAGQMLRGHVDVMLGRLHAAAADVNAVAAGEAGCLRVGTYQSVGRSIVPVVMQRLAASAPLLELQLTESATDHDLLPLVVRGDLDLTFSLVPLLDGPFEFVEVMRDPYVLVAPTDSSLLKQPVDVAALAGVPLIGFRQCRSLEPVESHLRARGVKPDYVFRTDDNGTLQAMVAAGVGVALVPLLTLQPRDERIAIIGTSDSLPERVIALAWHRERYQSRAMRAFVETVQAVCGELAGSLLRQVRTVSVQVGVESSELPSI